MLLLLACATPEPPTPIAFCEGEVEFLWDIEGALNVFPDDHRTTPADTPTGLRIALETATTPFLQEYPQGFVEIFDDLSTLDGWGVAAGMWFQADSALTTLPEVHVTADGVDHPVDVSTTDDGATMLLLPRHPLPEATEVTVVLTQPADACISPAPLTRALLDPATEDPPEQSGRYQTALAAVGIPPETVAAMSLFTTQSATHLSRAVAADVAARAYSYVPQGCSSGTTHLECEGVVSVQDYREEDHIVSPASVGTPTASYDLPTRVWLPLGTGPFPTALCGHGLGGDRGQCRELADIATPRGIAVVAVDAVEHGDHPGRTDAGIDLLDDLMILAISIDPPGLNARRLRDNFRQSAWDKLQVVRAIQGGADVDGDGDADLDPDHLAYIGVSLGAIMAPEPVALTDAFDGAVMLVGGARISSIIRDSATFSILVDLMRPAGTTDGDVERFWPVLQTVIDAGDPAIYATRLTTDRFDGATVSVLNGMAFEDEIVPNSTNEALARALALPGVGSEVWPIADVTFAPGPVSGNLPGGATGGTVQYAFVQEAEGGEWVAAGHDNLHSSASGQAEILQFLEPLMLGETPVIADPRRP